jgi:hypothetical protein
VLGLGGLLARGDKTVLIGWLGMLRGLRIGRLVLRRAWMLCGWPGICRLRLWRRFHGCLRLIDLWQQLRLLLLVIIQVSLFVNPY